MKRPAAFSGALLLSLLFVASGQWLGARCVAEPDAQNREEKKDWCKRFVFSGQDRRLVYDKSDRGDRIPDFSHSGYGGGGISLPALSAIVTVEPSENDDREIQTAIDHVGSLTPGEGGFRGVVQLAPGTFRLSGCLTLRQSGVVLRGSGSLSAPASHRSTLIATGMGRRSLIRIEGSDSPIDRSQQPIAITDPYLPCGTTSVTVDSTQGLAVGELVCVVHPGTKEWITALKMNAFPSRDTGSWLDWRPGTINQRWLRTITAVSGNSISLDAPITSSLDRSLCQAVIQPCRHESLVYQVGVENLNCISEVSDPNPKSDEHAWDGVTVDRACDIWVRNVDFKGFCGSAVSVLRDARRVSVTDCISKEPVSEDGGGRRQTYYTAGTQTLFLRCQAFHGRQDFCVGHTAAGPNVFSFCEAYHSTRDSGPIGNWASGVLFDNVTIDGAGLALTNYETASHGAGWASANGVLWNCVAATIVCRQPPTAQNYAIGVWGEFVGDGHWRQLNEFVDPESLLAAQLKDRLGEDACQILDPDQTVSAAAQPSHVFETRRESQPESRNEQYDNAKLILHEGRLLINGQLASGQRQSGQWWRGTVLPDQVEEFSDCITRFVPGHEGRGFTDNLDEVTDRMKQNGVLVYEHHWGLWYDRRRDDHHVVRRSNSDVCPPFYELPWARCGSGTAWDGLSRYDLTKFNPWYFNRLREFAGHCDRKGLVLLQHMYFQHNLLESGAHWVDFPWRPVNCLQATGFPEPPPLINRKRILLANDFWDVRTTGRRELHALYIRHCLNQLGDFHNVMFSVGEEYTGPAEFVEFWLDEIAAWQQERGRNVLVCLSCTKDVQDRILQQPERSAIVDVIDQKYWWYTSDGQLYAPPGGQNLSPRQQLREHKGSHKRTPESIAQGLREYRKKYPTKAVIGSFPDADADAELVVSAGGSFPNSVNVNAQRNTE